MKKEINLSSLTSPVIDLRNYSDNVDLHGMHQGGPLFIKYGRTGQQILANEAAIFSTEGFAIKIMGSKNITIKSDKLAVMGGIQVIGDLDNLYLENIDVLGGDVGLHMTQHNGTEQYGDIKLIGCSFSNCEREGSYIGKSEPDDRKKNIYYPKSRSITFIRCNFTRNFWDGNQAAHTEKFTAENCLMAGNGREGKEWQGKDLNLNYGVERADIINCEIPGQIQALGTTKLFIS